MKRFSMLALLMLAVAIVASGCSRFKGQGSEGSHGAVSTQAGEARVQGGEDYFYSARELEEQKEQIVAGRTGGRASIAVPGAEGIIEEGSLRGRGPQELIPISTVQITTADYELETSGTVGEAYEQDIRATGCESCAWTSTTLPPGLSGAEVSGDETRFRIQGEPSVAWQGDITVYVKESSSASWDASITWHLTIVDQTPPDDDGDDTDPCATPLGVKLKDFAGHQKPYPADHTFSVALGAKGQKLQFEVTGGQGPFTWTWTSVVEGSYKCWRKVLSFHSGWDWVAEDLTKCSPYFHRYVIPGWTQNMSWDPAGSDKEFVSGQNTLAPRAWYTTTEGRTLTLKGGFVYQDTVSLMPGPLPVTRNYDKDPVETLLVKVEDSCGNTANVHEDGSVETQLAFKLGYPDGTPGGRVKDLRVIMDYGDVGEYYSCGAQPYQAGAEAPYKEIDEEYCNGFILLLAQDKWSQAVIDDYKDGGWGWKDLLAHSNGYVIYDFSTCNADSETRCQEQQVKEVPGENGNLSLLDVDAIYIAWAVLPYWDSDDEKWWANFDIKRIFFESDYYYAYWTDSDDIYNDNVAYYYEIDNILNNAGMSSPATGPGGKSVVFIRRQWPHVE